MKNKKALERISQMEEIFDRCSKTVSEFEERITEFEELQSDIQKLEAYYTGKDWKNDLKLDEAGDLPEVLILRALLHCSCRTKDHRTEVHYEDL